MSAQPAKPASAKPAKRPCSWRRRWFRWCRISLLTAALLLLSALYYLNRVGLPDIIKNPLLAELRARGLDVYFSRLRLHWYRGIVAENINLGQATIASGPQLYIDEAEVRLNHAALRHFRLQIDALIIRKGRFCYPLPARGAYPATQFNLDEVSAELFFLPEDRWEIRQLDAVFLRAKARVRGAIDHASAWRKSTEPSPAVPPLSARQESLERNLRSVMKTMTAIQFTDAPLLAFDFNVDARNLATLKTSLDGYFAGVTTPWGEGKELTLTLRSQAANPGDDLVQTDIQIRADEWKDAGLALAKPSITWRVSHAMEIASPQEATGELTAANLTLPLLTLDHLQMQCQARAGAGASNWTARTSLSFSELATDPGRLSGGQMTADFTIDPRQPRAAWPARLPKGVSESWAKRLQSPWLPVKFDAQIALTNVQSRWGSAGKLNLRLAASTLTTSPAVSPTDDSLSYWALFMPYQCAWKGESWDVHTPWLALDRAAFEGDWQPPRLSIPKLDVHLYRGHFDAAAALNAATREAWAQGVSSFDVHQIGILLNTNAQKWLRQYTWEVPPLAQARAAVVLPAWTNSHPDWRREVLPTLKLDGYVTGGACAFRGAAADNARLHFSCDNGSWHIPDLFLSRPEGAVAVAYAADVPTQDFYWKLRSSIDPQALQPLLAPPQRKALALFQFTAPPEIQGEIWGRWHAVERLGFAGQLGLTNFTIRGEACDRLDTAVAFTNLFLSATNIRVRRGEGHVEAAGVGFDAARKRGALETTNRTGTLYFTNVTAQIEPGAVTRVIGPKTTAALEPYRFGKPPRVRVNGSMVVPGPDDADMAFEVTGGPFQYSKFNLPEVSGLVLWQGDSLTISNFQGRFYKGNIQGGLDADMHSATGSDIAFQLNVTNVDLRSFLKDMSTNSEKLEGVLSGQLAITHLNSQDWQSWFGRGQARVEQGVIWDIPIFGLFSKPLNLISDGLGNSRFEHAAGDFTITNSVIYSKNLEIRSPLLRLNCDGAVDFDQRVNLRLDAELFQDTWFMLKLLGKVITPFNKVFEYKVTGTLRKPKAEPVYIPKPFMELLHPFRTIKGVIIPESAPAKAASTNAPPATPGK